MHNEKNFVDFVLAAQDDDKLAKEFAGAKTGQELKLIFTVHGFSAITDQECTTLAYAKSKFQPSVDAALVPPGTKY